MWTRAIFVHKCEESLTHLVTGAGYPPSSDGVICKDCSRGNMLYQQDKFINQLVLHVEATNFLHGKTADPLNQISIGLKLGCQDCPSGQYSSNTGPAFKCKLCPIGKFRQNGTSCTLYPPGKFGHSNSYGPVCIDCPIGKYSSNFGSFLQFIVCIQIVLRMQ